MGSCLYSSTPMPSASCHCTRSSWARAVDQKHIPCEAQVSWDSTPPSFPALSPGPVPQVAHLLALQCPAHSQHWSCQREQDTWSPGILGPTALTACVQLVSRKNTDPALSLLLLESLAAALMSPVISLSH
jgi:hypothetical protein